MNLPQLKAKIETLKIQCAILDSEIDDAVDRLDDAMLELDATRQTVAIIEAELFKCKT